MAYDLHLADRIRVVLGRMVGFSERRMFGGLCFMVNGHMCCGIVNSALMLRLTPETAAAALSRTAHAADGLCGEPMKSMIYVDASGIEPD